MSSIRRSSGFLLIDNNKKFILQHRDGNIKRLPNYWAFFGGKIEKRETPKMSVRREAKEELGIKLKNLKFVQSYESKTRNEIQFIFIAPLTISLEKLRKQQEEGQGLKLFSLKMTENLKTPSFEKAILKDLFKRGLIA